MAGIEGKPRVVEYGRKSPFESFFGVFARELGHGISGLAGRGGRARQANRNSRRRRR